MFYFTYVRYDEVCIPFRLLLDHLDIDLIARFLFAKLLVFLSVAIGDGAARPHTTILAHILYASCFPTIK